MANRDLLKEAIADAKAVKETAIANAKAALEESFAPMLREKLAAKLAEMDKMEEEEEIKEVEDMKEEEIEETYDSMEEGEGIEEEEKVDEEMDLEELLRELDELEEGEESVDEALGTMNDPDTPTAHGNIAEEEEEEGEEEAEGEEGEEIDLENMEEEDLKKFIEDVIADMVEAGELEGNIESEDEEEMEMEVTETNEETMMENKEPINEIFGITMATIGAAKLGALIGGALLTYIGKQYASFMKDKSKQAKFDKELAAAVKANPPKTEADAKKLADEIAAKVGVTGDSDKATPDYKGSQAGGASAAAGVAEELEEAYNTIATIKEELAEVNLLNAKLLYTNKIFKAKNLSEAQKVKVLSAFDNASSVKETKLVYETLSANMKTPKTNVNESLIKGAASKPSGVSTKTQIVETDNQVSRWQKLAGIIK